jgi:hypothetical protein
MAVAKTYANCSLIGDPFKENGKWYVNVNAKSGVKKVRWYSDAEYQRMYPDTVVETDIMDFDARHAFGFGPEGYITIYKGKNVEEWADADRRNIRYNCTFLYYTPGRLERPSLIDGIEPIRLNWEQVAAKDNKMKPHEEVKKIVAALLQDDSGSMYQGEVNEWLQKAVTVRAKKSADSRYGTKHTYTLEDAEGNTYIWETGSKDYANNQTISLKMKVKEHKEIGNEKVTVVWYCKEV